MKAEKIQTMDTHFDRIIRYSSYVDCFSRILREFLENGYDNLKESDIAKIAVLLEKYSHRLHLCISKANTYWEFM